MFSYFGELPFIAVVGDIRKSKELADRKKTQDRLQRILIQRWRWVRMDWDITMPEMPLRLCGGMKKRIRQYCQISVWRPQMQKTVKLF